MKPIKNTDGMYVIYVDGQIQNTTTGKYLKPQIDRDGYQRIGIMVNGKQRHFFVHRLLAEHYLPHRPGCQVNHIDGDRSNNRIENLEWVSLKENVLHGIYVLGSRYKKVRQLSRTGELIKVWDSIKMASKELGIVNSSISETCKRKRKTAGGFGWEYH